jgi:hypothetical protein
MGRMSKRGITFNVARIGFVLIAAACAVGSVPIEAAARHNRHVAHPRYWGIRAQDALVLAVEPTHPGPIRYYGGPKSPMWRQ